MRYKILEARIEYKEASLHRVTVLVEMSPNDLRAIFANTKPIGGYYFIPPFTKLTDDLLQKVAAAGMETVDKDKIFPNWKHKATRNQKS